MGSRLPPALLIARISNPRSYANGAEVNKMRRSVPTHAKLEREARDLLRALRQRNAAAFRRYHSIDPLAGLSEPGLADAKYVIAREHGYSSWRKLETHIRLPNNSIKGQS